MKYLWILLGLLSAFITALVEILNKMGTRHVDSSLAGSIRSVVASIVFMVMFLNTKDLYTTIRSVDSRGLGFVILASLCYAVSWIVYLGALRLGPVTKVVSLDQLSLVFLLILAALIGEPVTIRMVIGGVFLVIGACMIVI